MPKPSRALSLQHWPDGQHTHTHTEHLCFGASNHVLATATPSCTSRTALTPSSASFTQPPSRRRPHKALGREPPHPMPGAPAWSSGPGAAHQHRSGARGCLAPRPMWQKRRMWLQLRTPLPTQVVVLGVVGALRRRRLRQLPRRPPTLGARVKILTAPATCRGVSSPDFSLSWRPLYHLRGRRPAQRKRGVSGATCRTQA